MIVLCVAAHPDDEVLGMGGTLARLAHEGHEVHVAMMVLRELELEAQAACQLLGVKALHSKQFPDQELDQHCRHITVAIEGLIKDIQPQAVYTHHRDDLNLDHAVVARAVLTAIRPKPDCLIKDVYMFEVLSSTEWGFNYQFKPNVFVEMTVQMPQKMDAMACYQSEMKPPPHPRSLELMSIQARRWGSVVGVHHAEAFELVRSLR